MKTRKQLCGPKPGIASVYSGIMASLSTMQEAIVYEGPVVHIINTPIPTPAAGQVLIKVHVTGSNPKDWKTWWVPKPINQGNDMAGIIHSVGEGVVSFQPGDRVFALHQLQAPHGSFAEYAIAWEGTTAHIPGHVSFEGKPVLHGFEHAPC